MFSVYETTVRPTSRRAEGVNRPKSGYNNRFQRERARNAPQPDESEDPIERPRTSRGHRGDVSESRQRYVHSPSPARHSAFIVFSPLKSIFKKHHLLQQGRN